MKNKDEHVIFKSDISDIDNDTVSFQEMTGLIPKGPKNHFERDAYEDIIDYSPEAEHTKSL